MRKIKAKKVGVSSDTQVRPTSPNTRGERLQGAECEGERDMYHFVHSLRIMPSLLSLYHSFTHIAVEEEVREPKMSVTHAGNPPPLPPRSGDLPPLSLNRKVSASSMTTSTDNPPTPPHRNTSLPKVDHILGEYLYRNIITWGAG